MRRVQPLDDIDEDETDIVEFDFSAWGTVQVSPAPTVTCAVISGIDATPSAMLVGSPTITVDELKVHQGIKGRPKGVTYRYRCEVYIGGSLRVLPAVIKTVRF